MKLKVISLVIVATLSWVCYSQAGSYRNAFIFFAINRATVVAVQSNPLYIADESASNNYILGFDGVFTAPGGGGTPVSGFIGENGATYGGVRSEVRLRAANVSEARWTANQQLFAHFTLLDTDLTPVESWDKPIFLRTIEHINFFFIQDGTSISQTIPGDLPSSPPDYNFTAFTWSAVPIGGLSGASLSFQHTDSGRTAALVVTGNPVSGWAQDNAEFNLTITSESTNPFDVCTAEFRGLSWDGLENSYPAAQPSVILRRLMSGGAELEGYYWFREQIQGGSAIDSPLPSGAGATGILQDNPLSGETVTLDQNCGLTGLSFSPSYPSSNNLIVSVTSPSNSFQSAASQPIPIRFRQFDIDYAMAADWNFPYAENPTSVPEAERTLSVIGGELFDWSDFSYSFNDSTTMAIESSVWSKSALLFTWSYGGLIDHDTGSIQISLTKSPGVGWPASTVMLSVAIGDVSSETGDINGDGSVNLEDALAGLQVLSGYQSPGLVRSTYSDSGVDVNGDNTVGLEEVLFVLQKVAGLAR